MIFSIKLHKISQVIHINFWNNDLLNIKRISHKEPTYFLFISEIYLLLIKNIISNKSKSLAICKYVKLWLLFFSYKNK